MYFEEPLKVEQLPQRDGNEILFPSVKMAPISVILRVKAVSQVAVT